MRGVVKRVVQDKGYGFIRSDVSGVEYFFHNSGFVGDWARLEEDVNIGEKVIVDFNDIANNKGPRAENVIRVTMEDQKNER